MVPKIVLIEGVASQKKNRFANNKYVSKISKTPVEKMPPGRPKQISK